MENSDKRIEKGKETKENIINATLRLFSQKGYDGTSIKDIADLAGIPKSLFYHYFKSKSEILEYVIQLYCLRITDGEKISAQHKPIDDTFEEITLRLFKNALMDKDILRIIMLEALKDKNIFQTLLNKMNGLREDFYSILPEDMKNAFSRNEINVFSFYFRFIPIIYFALTKDFFSEYYGMPESDLDKHLQKLISFNPYIGKP